MEVKVVKKDTYTVLKLKGSLDIYTSLDLKSSMETVPVDKDHILVFDMSQVDYVDSSGIGTLIKIANKVQDGEGEFFITGIKPMIEKIFKVAGLTNYFQILTKEEAEQKFPTS
ncbi:MAG: anti-sigma factor antagonist [Candidatus Hydrogenedentota bacterium]|nr:MAG: anti-sigma factor antagonist [Candidatus Hydrogenedentota bacterium]